VVVLPYREIDQSGVLYTALAFGKPLVLTRVGGFTEVGEEHNAARLVPPSDPTALANALTELTQNEEQRTALATAAKQAADTAYGWDAIAHQHMRLYAELLAT
jgi:glycosyltransferase involved in cell wall biosynthesis